MSTYGITNWTPEVAGADIVDIVFVHGLRGSGTGTWTASNNIGPWPAAFLPKDLSKANVKARILAFTYDANIVNMTGEPAGQNRIEQHARNLLGELNSERLLAGTEERPLVFVCHSLGGLVVKNALNLSSRSPEPYIRAILDHTKGVIFMGTPHLGADAAKYAKFLSGFASVFKPTMSDIVRVLERDSEVLATITSDFHEMLRVRAKDGKKEIHLVCFEEELPMHKFGISHTVVDRRSARIDGWPFFTIHADHVGMTKFENENDNGYKNVKAQLIMLTRPEKKAVAPANAVRASWTDGTRSGVYKTGDTNITRSNLSSGGGNMTVGSSMNFQG